MALIKLSDIDTNLKTEQSYDVTDDTIVQLRVLKDLILELRKLNLNLKRGR